MRSAITFYTYREVAARNHSFAEGAAMDVWKPTMTGLAERDRLRGAAARLCRQSASARNHEGRESRVNCRS
ncbi:MAG: hypothetical protein ABI693_31215 [Bryobacteraceae bacterium]